MAIVDLSILTKAPTGSFMGRSFELWKELGMLELVYKAMTGDADASKKCMDSL